MNLGEVPGTRCYRPKIAGLKVEDKISCQKKILPLEPGS